MRSLTMDNILFSSKSNEWYTPIKYIEAVKNVLGVIDCDPASNAKANEIIQAKRYYNIEDNGLYKTWEGKVFLNPPYGKSEEHKLTNQALWTSRLIKSYKENITTEAILLVNASKEAKWFKPLWNYPICFTDHRIKFVTPNGISGSQPTKGSAFIYFGTNIKQFCLSFYKFGVITKQIELKL